MLLRMAVLDRIKRGEISLVFRRWRKQIFTKFKNSGSGLFLLLNLNSTTVEVTLGGGRKARAGTLKRCRVSEWSPQKTLRKE